MKEILSTFRAFYQRHSLFLGKVIPLILLTSATLSVLNALWISIFMFYFWLKNKRTTAILLAHTIFILGDSREFWLAGIKPMRNLAMSLLFLLTIWDMVRGKYKFNTTFLYWIPFILWAIYGITLSPILVDCALRTLSYVFMLFITLHVVGYEYKNSQGLLVADWISFMNLVFTIGLVLLIIKPDWVILDMQYIVEADDARYQGIYGNPNGLGGACTVMYGFLIIERFILKIFSKKYSNYSIVLMGISLLLCGSRASLLSILLFSIFFYIENRSLIVKNVLKYVFIPLGGIFTYLFGFKIVLAIPFLAERLRLSEGMGFEEVTSGRGQVWKFLFTMGRFSKIDEWIWTGKGFFFDSYFFQSLVLRYQNLPRQYGAAFSGMVSLTMNHGIIGIVIFFLTHIMVYRQIKIRGIALSIFILMFFSSIFEGWIISSLNAFSLVYYSVVAIAQIDISLVLPQNNKPISTSQSSQ